MALVLAAAWPVVLWLPYTSPLDESLSLLDAARFTGVTASVVTPRVVGSALVALTALAALVRPRWRVPLWSVSGSALLGLACYVLWWVSGLGTGPDELRRSGWDADLALAALALGIVVLGAVGLVRAAKATPPALDRSRLPSTPVAAVLTAVVAIAATWCATRESAFVATYAFGTKGVLTDELAASMRLVGLVTAVAMVVLPMLAVLAPDRRLATGLALGWTAFVAVPASAVVAAQVTGEGFEVDGRFGLGLLLVAGGTVGLLVWIGRTGPGRLLAAAPTAAPEPSPTSADPTSNES